MYVQRPGTTIYWDVDDTIIMWDKRPDSEFYGEIEIECLGMRSKVQYHKRHVELIKRYGERGASNIVWSHGGSLWAEAVVRALGLENYVSACINKPTMYYDDLSAEKFMKQRRFFNTHTGKDELF